MQVKFTTKHRPYNPGEVANFPDVEGKRLVQMGVAEPVASAPRKADAPKVEQKVMEPDPESRMTYETKSPMRRGPGRPRKSED